jgi:flagellar hook-associated protein 2
MIGSIGYSLGIGSGLDIANLVNGLAAAERAPKEALIQRREEANAAKISALAEASSAIDSFASALSSLISGGTLFTQPSVSDTSILSATTVAGSQIGNLSAQIEVVQLAKAQTLSSAGLSSSTEAVGEGELTLTTAVGSFVVTIDATNNSLEGLRDAINGKNAGVTASIVTDQGTAKLVLKGATGTANAFTLSVPDGTVSGLERFAFGPTVTGGMTEAQAAQDAIVKLDGVELRRSSNSFKDLVDGVQFDLKKAAPGTIVNLGISRPTAAIEQAVGNFVAAYNELNTLLANATAPGVNGAGGPLRGDLSIRDMRRQLGQLTSTVLNSRGSIKTLAEIGVRTNRDGSLSLSTSQLQQALQNDPQGVEALFNPTQYSSDPLLVITSPMGKVKPGTYTFTNVVPESGGVAASGEIDGIAALGSGAFLIAPPSSAAVGLAVEVKGALASATITVDPGLGGALQAIRDALRARSGPIAKSQERLSEEAKDIAEDRTKLETRSKAYYDRLLEQFTTMERQVSAFKATQSYLEQQIKAWNSDND